MNPEDYENVAPTRPDRVRAQDIAAFKALASIEGRKIISKEEVADGLYLTTTHVTDESFDFFYDSRNVTYRFNIRKIKDAIVAARIPFRMFRATITEKWYNLIMKMGGIEEDRIPQLTDLNRPGLVVIFEDGNSLIIDGNHRLVARYRRGTRIFRYAAVTFDDIWPFIMYMEGKSDMVA